MMAPSPPYDMAVSPLPTPADSRLAFLFRCGNTRVCAITLDETGGNLPKDEGEDGWHLLRSFALGVQEPIPASVTQRMCSPASNCVAFISGTS